jgi:4-hydroxy-4-methyl-2-oxoglutarate aldolase
VDEMIKVGADFNRLDNELIEGFKKTTTATIGHVLEKEVCDAGIKPVYRNVKLVGTAYTVQLNGRDIGAISKAYALAKSGDVLVVNSGRQEDQPIYACAGEMSTYKSVVIGLAGLIVDGAITDVLEMEEIGFPCFSRHVTALVGKPEGKEGAVQVPVNIGGVTVYPGDLVIADDNGVVFLNPEQALEILPQMLAKEDKENVLRENYKKELDKHPVGQE